MPKLYSTICPAVQNQPVWLPREMLPVDDGMKPENDIVNGNAYIVLAIPLDVVFLSAPLSIK